MRLLEYYRWCKERAAPYGPAIVFVVCGLALFVSTLDVRPFNTDDVSWDLQWLNAWALGFCFLSYILWRGRIDERTRRVLLLGCFSIFGFVAVSLIFNGTPYSINSYWGDQKFRQAMLLKFSTFIVPHDFYYKNRPPFYPPFYFWLLSLWGRVFSVEYYKLLKVGSQLMYLLGPALVYWFWVRVVSKHQAFWIALAVFTLGGFYYNWPLGIPHEFIAGSLFIPWWLFYVEQVRCSQTGWKYYLFGGLIGAGIFMTYYYAFVVGGVWLAFKLVRRLLARGAPADEWSRLLRGCNHASQREWFHNDYAGLHFLFLKFTFPGFLFLFALIYSFRLRVSPIYHALLALVWSAAGVYLVGYLLGNMGQPILYIKANEFLYVMGGVMAGLMLAGLIRWDRRTHRARGTFGLIALILLLICFHDFSGLVRSKEVETARTSKLMDWGTDAKEMAERAGSVFLTANELLPSFFPIYVFNAINQHYSHNSGQYISRHQLLVLLEELQDPLPRIADGQFELWSNLSRYPDRFVARTMRFPQSIVADPALFIPRKGEYLYQVADSITSTSSFRFQRTFSSASDSLIYLFKVNLLKSHLDDAGRRLIEEYLPIDTTYWYRLNKTTSKNVLGSGFGLVDGAYLIPRGDSLVLLMALELREPTNIDYRIFLHLYPSNGYTFFDNYDFLPSSPTSTWQKWDQRVCYRIFPASPIHNRLHLGLFLDAERTGPGWWSDFPQLKE
ncbi:MAG: hypothetical protein NTW07_06190 [candidate division Zixibacteria bacterium]|nr:hypothetical protein [candidate division Zixibacteria bacterium]